LTIRSLFRRPHLEADLNDELEDYLAHQTERYIASGLSPEEARYAALRSFGNRTSVKESTRNAWGWSWLESTGQDLRYALRFLGKSRVFTITAILSLAIGIGMNTAIFSLVDAVLLRNLPVRSPEDLVVIAERSGSRDSFSLSWPEFQALRGTDALEGMAAFRPWRFRTSIHGEPKFINGQLVSGNYFSLLGVPAVLGRTLANRDDQAPGASPVAVLSYDYWQRECHSDTAVIGHTMDIQGYPFTVIGVSAPDFFGLEPGVKVDVTVPLAMQAIAMPGTPLLNSPDARWLRLIGRRKPGVSLQRAQAALSVVWGQFRSARSQDETPRPILEVLPGAQGLYDLRRKFSLPLRALMAAVALILLIACANLGTLLLARATARRQEIDLRLSLGATRGRLLRQLLTESILLSIMGGICGIEIAYAGSRFLVDLMSTGRSPIFLDLAIDAPTLLFTFAVSLATGLLFGIVPALRAIHAESVHGNRLVGKGSKTWARILILSQISLCLAILVCAGLLLESVDNLRSVDVGFRVDHVLLMSIRPSLSHYDKGRSAQLYRELYRRFSGLPGVESVTLSMDTPLGGVSYTARAFLPSSAANKSSGMDASVNAIGPRFFETMGIPLLTGRDLNLPDNEHAPEVALISESVARGLFRDRSPLGQRLQIGDAVMYVVGVVKDTRYNGLRKPPTPMVYRPYLQMEHCCEELFFGIRTFRDPESLASLVRRELREAAPSVPILFSARSKNKWMQA
jgi:predicted permease